MSVVSNLCTKLARTASSLNSSVGALCLRLFPETSGLIVLAFHALIRDWSQPDQVTLDPRYALSLAEFEQVVIHYLSRDFQAVSPEDVLRGLDPKRRYVMFTFDDGYANNLQVVPLLEKHRVPAVFALVTDHVVQQKAFWWDVIHRQKVAWKDDPKVLDLNVDALIPQETSMIENVLVARFGKDVLQADSENSRTMHAEEVRSLAGHPLVHWANHTSGHEYLPNCDQEQVRRSVGMAQDVIQELTRARPVSIAFPFGGHSPSVRAVCRNLGLRLGFSMNAYKQSLDMDWQSDRAMALPRFAIYHGACIDSQCRETRMDWKPSWLLRGRPASRISS